MAQIGNGLVFQAAHVPHVTSLVAIFRSLARAMGAHATAVDYEHSVLLHNANPVTLNGLELPGHRFNDELREVRGVWWARVEPGVIKRLRYFPYDGLRLELERIDAGGWRVQMRFGYIGDDAMRARRYAVTMATFLAVTEPGSLRMQDDGVLERHLLPLPY